ncbi:TetR/AcrR family transcriptional regulator [Limnohabitans sp. Hippo3]|uniref:TetR/AcrR family transcriptional regulator n=1 Tax=Limnohabitans sp. Hippo3 TaxID=1597956 RepID=UPI000D344333|nr:TetR/AcrR family transcriptional regulator [Limnohabitans sp. Hippo3]PUE43945.1 TetR family transcriptional regulator [Limnohabitans sp. Hippo3]
MNQLVHSYKNLTADTDSAKETGRTNDPARTMAEILAVATHEFADKGLTGARIDAIAAATRTSKRMIYYYFGSKDGLYLAVLEEAYRRMRTIESDLHLDDLPPMDALKKLVEFTYDHHRDNEDFIRLVMNENIQRGDYLRKSQSIQQLNFNAIASVKAVYDRGVAQGVFRSGLDPVDIHSAISAFTFFNVSNRHTFGLIFQDRASQDKATTLKRVHVVELIQRFVSHSISA